MQEIQIRNGKLRGTIHAEDLAACPMAIYRGDHWLPRHNIEECGGQEVIPTIHGKKSEEKTKPIRVVSPKIIKPKIIEKENTAPMSIHYEAKELTCIGKECPNGNTFIFSGEEQKFLRKLAEQKKDEGFVYTEPKRCKECREQKRKFFNQN